MNNEKMSLEIADTIRSDFGKFLEITSGSLSMIFGPYIPESLLPYPKNRIEEALMIAAEFFHKQENAGAVNAMEVAKAFLLAYVPNKEALERFRDSLNDKHYLEIILPNLELGQQKQFDYVKKNNK